MSEYNENSIQTRLYKTALFLRIFTILANIIEGIVSTLLGFRDESLALFGFGIDSYIEVLSAVGITIMIIRINKNHNTPRSKFEVTALRITGISFYILTAGLVATSVYNLVTRAYPETTFWGIIISIASLSVMIFLYLAKLRLGRRLNSNAIIADANCTKACIFMSAILLFSSLVFELTGFIYIDVIGALGIAWFSFSEGREAFEKSIGKDNCEF